ncbi:MAG: D-sedoheptulose 7-phosphate isomerase [Candidatus Omnitrophica bacterium]|nr:D-sedoheptulose 7-phosphate isomerase [Candidatus Omnitrophota bacterium]
MREKIKDILLQSIQIKEQLLQGNVGDIVKIAGLTIECLKKGGKLIIFGNGGSASDSQHIAAELVGRFKKERAGLPAIALTSNTSILTAIANDYGYDIVFARQIEALGGKNDIAIGISTSGKAKNVALGIKQAHKMGIKTAALTGGDGGDIAKIADVSLIVPSNVTARIQEAHISVGHVLCELIEEYVS